MSRPDSLFEMAYTARDTRKNRRGNLRFLPELEMRCSSIVPNPVESREAPPNSTVFLTSHRHPRKLPEVTFTSRGNTGFPCHNSRKTSRFPLQCVLRPDSTVVTREKCCALRLNSNGDWTSLVPHERLLEFPVITREKPHTSHCSSKKTTRFPGHRQMKPFFF